MSEFSVNVVSRLPAVSRASLPTNAPPSTERQNVSQAGKDLPQATVKETRPTETVPEKIDTAGLSNKRNTELQFEQSEIAKRTLITVRDAETGDVVRQIPTKAVIAIARYMAEISPEANKATLIDESE